MPGKFGHGEDTIEFEIAENGEIIMTTPGQISGANHASADQFLKATAKMAGGKTKTTKLKKTHTHAKAGAANRLRQ